MKRTHSSDVGQRSFKYPGICVEPASLLHGEPNRVSTTRFTPLTWLPKSLFLQFQRAANIYFLFIAVIVCMPFSPKRWQSKVFPYILVLAWTALKDLYEDSRRKMDDHVENSRMCWRFSMEHGFEQIAWRRVKPGDFVCTMCDEAFPADLLVVCAAGGYSAFISTVNLDGETNLKLRRPPNLFCSLEVDLSSTARPTVPPTVASHVVSQACRQQLHIHLASPCADLTEFNASLSLDAPDVQSDVQGSHSASCDSFVPRGCVLRNTDWLLSIVAYAGKDTKQCLNSAQVSGKVSNMQSLLNRCVYGLLTGLFFTCCYMATAAKIIDSNTEWPIRFLAYAITLYHVVPISLYVAFEVLKLMLGRFIDKDPQLFGAAARTADLVEELGQIDFIFSDKTGTLTSNDMRFARCAVGDKVFDSFLQDSLGGPVPGVEQVTSIFNEGPTGSGELGSKLRWFFTCLAVCNTVEVNEKTQYSGPSPDEVALVQGAHLVGISLKERVKASKLKKEEHVVVSTPEVEDRVFSILHTIEFSADRKRMSVICRHEGAIYCITKGADSIMSPLLIAELGQEEEEQLRRFSQMGLRTLVVASKQVDPSTFASWEADWLSAKTLLEGRTEKLAECGATIEKDLQLSGISAVEDRLQEGVPDAIADLKQAGIRFWVLTGDKTETAVDIAHSCNLFSKDTGLAFLTGATDALGAQTCLALAQKHLEHGKCGSIDKHVDNGLVIDGQTLQWILEGHAEDELYKLGMLSIGCVCSRLSPAQKRRLVDVVRKHSNSITLAIGDGANDVPMILGAHVGIGLRGKEGSQAVQASDIAISQFRFIVPLLMCHGRRAYRRVATFLCYYFYKNVALAMGDLIWAHQNSFSGEVAYPEWLSTSFNAVFTWWPVIFALAFDEDVSDVMSNTNPKIYIEGVERKWFNLQVFGWWMISAAFHGSLSWLLPMLCFGSSDYDAVTFWRASSTSFTMVIFVVALKLALHDFKRLSISCLLPVAGSVASYVIVLLLLGYLPLGQKMQPNLSDGGELPVPGWIFSNVVPLILITLGPMAALIPDILILWWGRKWHPSPLFEVRHGIHQACL